MGPLRRPLGGACEPREGKLRLRQPQQEAGGSHSTGRVQNRAGEGGEYILFNNILFKNFLLGWEDYQDYGAEKSGGI